MSKGKILIVEDEAIVANDLSQKLCRLGYEVSGITARGGEAVGLAREQRPDLVLMDIRLQGRMDGVEAAEIIRRECDLPVIYLTAHSDSTTLQRAKLTEPFGYVLKPFEELELETHIQMALYKHQAERKLRQSEERYRLLFDRNPDGVFTVDMAGRFVAANPACETLSGYPVAELLRMSFMELCAPDQLARTVESFHRGLCGLESLQLETALLRKDGRRVELWIAGDPLPAGQTTIVHCTAKNITERKRVETALRESELRYRAIGESIDYGVWVCAPDGRNTYASPSFLRLVGITQQQCSDFGWGNVLHPEDSELTIAAWKECVRTGGTWDMEQRFRGVDGQWHPILARGVPVRDEQGQIVCWAGINLDISRLKRVEEDLSKSKDELAKTNANLEQLVGERTAKLQELVGELEHFSYTITHDMRAPLRGMKGFGELVSDLCATCEHHERREFIRKIMISAERMDRLITDALNYSRSVRQELPLEDVDAGALLRGMLDNYPELQPTKAHIRIEGELPVVVGNPAGLTQCLSNLLGNAVKFVKPGEKAEICVRADHRDGWARIWVEDKGIGIPKEMLPRVFDMFSRGSRNYEGTGIGLALVRKVAQRMGGRVGVESEPGKGSRFWVELPVSRALGEP